MEKEGLLQLLLQAFTCPETTSVAEALFSLISPPSSPVAHDSAHAPTHHTTYNQLYRLEVRSKLAGSLTLRV